MRIWRVVLMFVVGMVAGACDTSGDDPVVVPTRVNQDEIAATFGVPPEEAIAETQTARAPTTTNTPSQTFTPSPILPSSTSSITPTPTNSFTPTPNPIVATETRIFELTIIAETATAPTITPTPTDTPTPTSTMTTTPTITLTPSNTFEPREDLPDNPQPNAVVFASNRNSTADIWVMTLNGEPSRPLVVGDSNEFMAACDPQGELIVFESDRDEARALYLSEIDGSGTRRLTDIDGETYQPIWSPTGDAIAYVSTQAGNADIWLANRAGTSFTPVTTDSSAELYPSWSPDGNVLFYSAERDGNFDIFQYNVETEEESRITNTPDVDERYPVLSPNFQNIVYIAEVTSGDPQSAAAFVLDSNGFIRVVADVIGALEAPYWVNDRQLLLSGDLGGNSIQVLLADVLSAEDPRVLTQLGNENRWPRYCYIAPGFLATLPTTRATPVLRATVPTPTPVTPTLTPTFTVTPSPTPLDFDPVDEPPANWLISRETWTGDEFAFIAPDFLPSDTRGFQVGNLLNLTWRATDGTAVVTLALEPFRGELAATLIGYTIDDLPAFPPVTLNGIETAVNRALLRNSVMSSQYSLTEVTFTDVNLTLTFRVPAIAPQAAPSAHTVFRGSIPNGWLISTERWAADELSTLAEVGGLANSVVAVFVGDQVQYNWIDADGVENVLLVRYVADNGELVVNPISYTRNGAIDTVDTGVLYILRESILTNSINPGDFFLSRIEPDFGAFELVFLVPPRLPQP